MQGSLLYTIDYRYFSFDCIPNNQYNVNTNYKQNQFTKNNNNNNQNIQPKNYQTNQQNSYTPIKTDGNNQKPISSITEEFSLQQFDSKNLNNRNDNNFQSNINNQNHQTYNQNQNNNNYKLYQPFQVQQQNQQNIIQKSIPNNSIENKEIVKENKSEESNESKKPKIKELQDLQSHHHEEKKLSKPSFSNEIKEETNEINQINVLNETNEQIITTIDNQIDDETQNQSNKTDERESFVNTSNSQTQMEETINREIEEVEEKNKPLTPVSLDTMTQLEKKYYLEKERKRLFAINPYRKQGPPTEMIQGICITKTKNPLIGTHLRHGTYLTISKHLCSLGYKPENAKKLALMEEEMLNDMSKDAKSFASICNQRYTILGYSLNKKKEKK